MKRVFNMSDFLDYKFIRVSKTHLTSKEHGLLRIKYLDKNGFRVYGLHKHNPLISETIPLKQVMNIDLMDKNIEVLFGVIS